MYSQESRVKLDNFSAAAVADEDIEGVAKPTNT